VREIHKEVRRRTRKTSRGSLSPKEKGTTTTLDTVVSFLDWPGAIIIPTSKMKGQPREMEIFSNPFSTLLTLILFHSKQNLTSTFGKFNRLVDQEETF
jgi:hypothetical protein